MNQNRRIPVFEIENRIGAIQHRLKMADIEALFIVQRVDLLYFSGTAQHGFLFIPAEGKPLLLIKRYYPRAKAESPISDVVEIESVKETPAHIRDAYGRLPKTLAFELDVLPVNEFNFYQRLFPDTICVDGATNILETRMIKSEWEIAQLTRTAHLSARTFQYMRETIRPGLTEMEFAGMFEAFAKKYGHAGKLRLRDYQAEGYPWHVLSGSSGGRVGLLDSPASGEGTSPAFPVGAGDKKMAPNEPVMIDLALVLSGYHTDETRMFAIRSMPEEAMNASLAAIEVQNAVLEAVKPGISANRLFEIAIEKAHKFGYADQFLGPPGYKVRFIGHGIGLELVEPPILSKKNKAILKPGMTFSVEPKMVFKDRFSAGVETMFVVTDTGYRLISEVPTDIFVC